MTVDQPILVLTRPQVQAQSFANACYAELGPDWPIIISPLQKIIWVDRDFDDICDVVIFTSQNGVQGFLRRARSHGRPAWCVGDKTARLAEENGFVIRGIAGDAATLIKMIAAGNPPERMAHYAGLYARGDIVENLSSHGISIRKIVVYEQVSRNLSAAAASVILGRKPVVLPMFSPRTARLLMHEVKGISQARVICISAATAAEIDRSRFPDTHVVAAPSGTAMLKAVLANLNPR